MFEVKELNKLVGTPAARFKHIRQNNINVLLKLKFKNKQTKLIRLKKEFFPKAQCILC